MRHAFAVLCILLAVGSARCRSKPTEQSLPLAVNVMNANDILSIRGRKHIEEITVQGPWLHSLEGFEFLESADVVDLAAATSLTTIQQLANLTEIHRTLDLSHLDALESLEGLHNVQRIGFKGLTVHSNPKIRNFTGLRGLRDVYGISIGYNASLESLAGLYDVKITGDGTQVTIDAQTGERKEVSGGSLTIIRNPNLPRAEIDTFVKRIGFTGNLVVCENKDDVPCVGWVHL